MDQTELNEIVSENERLKGAFQEWLEGHYNEIAYSRNLIAQTSHLEALLLQFPKKVDALRQ